MKNSTTKDSRYLNDQGRFIEYAFLALGGHFPSRDDFLGFFNRIKTNKHKSLFLRTASFYLFLVKQGDWTVNVPGSEKVVDYLTNTYKYIAIFSLIESLYDEDFVDFYEFIGRCKSDVQFPISRNMLDEIYKKYKKEFGSIKRCISFFKALSPDRQGHFTSQLTIKGKHPTIEEFAKYLYELRSKFVHEAELVLHISDGTSASLRRGDLVTCSLSITDAMTFFEEGLIEYFKDLET